MKSYFDSLPSDIRDVLTDERLDKEITQYCKESGVGNVGKVLIDLTTSTLMAIQPIKGFVGRIAQAANIPTSVAQKIANEINENIFRPVRQSLIKIHEIPPNEQAQIPAVEPHFEHLLEIHAPSMIALAKPAAAKVAPVVQQTSPMRPPATQVAPKTLAEQKMSRPTSLPPQISRTSNEPDPYREPIA